MKQGLTLQINSVEALERLLGGSTEIELKLRQSVAAAFVDNYITDMVKNALGSEETAARKRNEEQVNKLILQRASDHWSQPFELSNDAKKLTKEAALEAVRDHVNKIHADLHAEADKRVTDVLRGLPQAIEAKVTERINQQTAREIHDKVNSRLKQLAAALDATTPDTRKVNVG